MFDNEKAEIEQKLWVIADSSMAINFCLDLFYTTHCYIDEMGALIINHYFTILPSTRCYCCLLNLLSKYALVMFNSALVCDVETFEYNMGFVSLEK